MKFKWITAIAITAMATISCSEDTEGIGASLTDENDIKMINRTLDLLDDDDDVQNVYHNWDE